MRPLDILSSYQLLRNQWKSAEELREIQNRKLRRLIRYAYSRVPYYRRLFDSAGIRPENIAGVEDLLKIPTTSRKELMSASREETLAQGIDLSLCRSTRTSGSTGTPLRIFHRREDLSRSNLGWVRSYLAHGFRPWHRMVEFGGQRYSGRDKSWHEYLGLMQREVLDSSDDPDVWISELQAWKPHALVGFASTLRLLAEAMEDQSIADVTPKVIFSTSEWLDDATRRFLSSVFQAKVIDIYGSEEGRCIAWECDRCSGYHINADLVIVEFLGDGKPVPKGSDGEIVITNLHSFAMPFIRYEQADVGALVDDQPICGRGLPLMSMVKGRLDDFIVLANGRRVSPQVFYYAVAPIGGVAEWRAVQEIVGELKVEVVVAHGPRPGRRRRRIKRRIEDNLEEVLGDNMELNVEMLSSIPRVPGEKHRSVLSLVHKRSYDPCLDPSEVL